MSWTIYYIITILLNIIGCAVFRRYIHINVISLLPLFLMLDSAFQAYYYHTTQAEKDFNAAYGIEADVFSQDSERISTYIVKSHLFSLPLFIPFICFFSWGKILSFFVFWATFGGVGIRYRMILAKEEWKRENEETVAVNEQNRREENDTIK